MKKTFSFLTILMLQGLTLMNSIKAQEPFNAGQLSSTIIEDGGTGLFKAIITSDSNLNSLTIYRPNDLSVFGNEQKLQVVLWGNGGCFNSSEGFKNFLNEIASNGYIVFAIGPYETLIKSDQEIMRQPTKSVQLIDALNWITEQNNNKTSIYFNKIDVSKVAVMGQSCGGLQAIEVSTDPRITTTVVCNSGILNTAPPMQLPSLPVLKKELLQQLHAPILYLLGGKGDIAYENGTDDFSRITKVPAVIMNQEVGHGGTYGQPNGGSFAVAAKAWLSWQLKGDIKSSLMFIGDDCGFCKDPQWKIETKNINQ